MRHRATQKQDETVRLLPSPRSGRNQRRKQIRILCDAIVREFHPEKIVLFGSYAYGDAHQDSDVDLVVVMPFEGSPFRQAARILSHVVRTVGVLPMDLLVRRPEQVRERMRMDDSFMREIIERGKVIYETRKSFGLPI